MGIALLLTGIGLLVMTIRWLREPATPREKPVVAAKPAVAYPALLPDSGPSVPGRAGVSDLDQTEPHGG